ncbi:hypothetical protein GEMRC1_002573 [Eukaryota sp. GEM-RC1]
MCDSADQNQNSRFFKYSDWFVNECNSCQLFESINEQSLHFSTNRPAFDEIEFSFILPYVRNGQFWLLDFNLIESVSNLSTCSNRVLPEFTDDLFSRDYDSISITAPNAEQSLALENYEYFAYFNSNIYSIEAYSCSQISYSVSLTYSNLMKCQNLEYHQKKSDFQPSYVAIRQTSIFYNKGILTSQIFSHSNFSNFFHHYSFVSNLIVLNFELLSCTPDCVSTQHYSHAVFSAQGIQISFPKIENLKLVEIHENSVNVNFSSASNQIVLFVDIDAHVEDLFGFYNFSTSKPTHSLSFTIEPSVLPSPLDFDSRNSLSISKLAFNLDIVSCFEEYFNFHDFGPYSDNRKLFALVTSFDEIVELSDFKICDFNSSCVSIISTQLSKSTSVTTHQNYTVFSLKLPRVQTTGTYLVTIELSITVFKSPIFIQKSPDYLLLSMIILTGILIILIITVSLLKRKQIMRKFSKLSIPKKPLPIRSKDLLPEPEPLELPKFKSDISSFVSPKPTSLPSFTPQSDLSSLKSPRNLPSYASPSTRTPFRSALPPISQRKRPGLPSNLQTPNSSVLAGQKLAKNVKLQPLERASKGSTGASGFSRYL